jgi:hypothetical protein
METPRAHHQNLQPEAISPTPQAAHLSKAPLLCGLRSPEIPSPSHAKGERRHCSLPAPEGALRLPNTGLRNVLETHIPVWYGRPQ